MQLWQEKSSLTNQSMELCTRSPEQRGTRSPRINDSNYGYSISNFMARFMVSLSLSESCLVSVSISRLEALNRAENLVDD